MRGRLITGTVLATASISCADTIHVPGDHATIQGALDAASFFGDTIQIAAGTYYEYELSAGGKAVQVVGATGTDGSPAVTIDAQQSGNRVLLCESNEQFTTGFSNLVLTGGGIYLYEANPTFTNCWIVENTTNDRGGGVFISDGMPRFAQCMIKDNESQSDGGGVYVEYGAQPVFIDCSITGNTTLNDGGGFHLQDDSMLTCTNCIISGNTAHYGGGLNVDESSLTFNACIINDNAANVRGGGLHLDDAPVAMESCSISGNTAVYGGGGIYAWGESLTLTDCSITANSTDATGGGLFAWDTVLELSGSSICDNAPDQMDTEWIDVASCGDTGSTTCDGDVNGDGSVDITDLLLVIGNWGMCP